ncbi:MAG: tryptophan 7-halogenase [Nocardiopsaceae bacterium]|nr:tryptophan 7-halogenase [Nocardiopsaceae bacterium]
MTISAVNGDYDAVVIGGGPAGSSAAIGLARHGYRALLLERREFPRFHIGESMLPYMSGLLRRKGFHSRLEQCGFPVKHGAEFTNEKGQKIRVDFGALAPARQPWTFQVERSRLDQAMLQWAREMGTTVLEEANVNDVLMDNGRISALRYERDGETFEVRAPYVIDASGRAGKLAHRFGLRKTNEHLRMVAIYRHYTGLDESMNPGYAGDIQIGGGSEGWLWAIPIASDKISVGAVVPREQLRSRTADEIFSEYSARFPRVAQRLRGTRPLTELRMETDYCYYADQVTGPGWLMAGDSGCFADPVFSAGVFLAMTTGFEAADAIDRIRQGGTGTEEAVLDHYARFYKTGYDTYFRIIYAYYDSKFNFKDYLKRVAPGIDIEWTTRILSGDFWSMNNPIGNMLRDEPRWDTFSPFERVRVCPVYPELDTAESARPWSESAGSAPMEPTGSTEPAGTAR